MAAITIISAPYAQHPDLWNTLLQNDPAQYFIGFPIDQEYSHIYAPQTQFSDLSLIAVASGIPVAGLQITEHSDDTGKKIGFYGRPALLRKNKTSSADNLEKAEKLLAQAFAELTKDFAQDFDYLDHCDHGTLSEFSVTLLRAGCKASPLYRQMIDLTPDDTTLRQGLRKSYRSLISWGEKNMTITVHDHANVTMEAIQSFHHLHVAVAGKETRNLESWNHHYRLLQEKQGFLITGHLEGQLVTAALFGHSAHYCVYGVSASIREMFDKPLSHVVLWRSILEAKQRGCLLYEMGDLADLYPSGFSDKEKNIAVFKRGFGGTARLQLKIQNPDNAPRS